MSVGGRSSDSENNNLEIGVSVGTREEAVRKYRTHDKDTGSPEVQVAVLTHRLEGLKRHFEKHKLDKHSQRGLLQIVSKRKRLLGYLRDQDVNRYRKLIADLGIRK
ncbi:MAG: 30S ribosomal protein S15 [Bdellovibrionales bacterium]|nr:30S ribosomal protein S15 [Bdellovibrionales bacterium]